MRPLSLDELGAVSGGDCRREDHPDGTVEVICSGSSSGWNWWDYNDDGVGYDSSYDQQNGSGGGDDGPCYLHDLDLNPLSQLTVPGFSGPSPSLQQLNALVERAIDIKNTSILGAPAAAAAGFLVAHVFGAVAGPRLAQLYLFAEEYNLSPLGLPAEGLLPGYSFDTKYYEDQGPYTIDQDASVPAFEPVGNFLYGYLGKVAGLTDAEIFTSAALAAGGTDDPRDVNNIRAGIEYFRQNGDRGFTNDQVGNRPC